MVAELAEFVKATETTKGFRFEVKTQIELEQLEGAARACYAMLGIRADFSHFDSQFLNKLANKDLVQSIDLNMLKAPDGTKIAFEVSTDDGLGHTTIHIYELLSETAKKHPSYQQPIKCLPAQNDHKLTWGFNKIEPDSLCFASSDDPAPQPTRSWMLQPESYDEVRDMIRQCHLLGEETETTVELDEDFVQTRKDFAQRGENSD